MPSNFYYDPSDNDAKAEREKSLPLFARYGGAWNEYNTRITARQSITQMWLAAITVLVGATYAAVSAKSPTDAAAVAASTELALLTAFAIPIVCVLHSLLMWMHDEMLANLHVYMIECELIKNTDLYMPSYHADPKWHYLNTRKWQNYTFIGICVVFCLGGYIPVQKHFHWYHNAYWLGMAIALYLHWKSFRIREMRVIAYLGARGAENLVRDLKNEIDGRLAILESKVPKAEQSGQPELPITPASQA